MLWNPVHGLPIPQNRAEWIGLLAGMGFAMLNVLVRRTQHLSVNFKSASVWFGTVLLTGYLCFITATFVSQVQGITLNAWWLLTLIGLVLCATSIVVQYGLTHLPANQAIVLFLSELVSHRCRPIIWQGKDGATGNYWRSAYRVGQPAFWQNTC